LAYGLHLTIDQREWRAGDFSSADKLTGTIYTDEDKTTAKDLTGYSVQSIIYKQGGSANFSKTATIVTAANGTWSYAVADGEMVPQGIYLIECELTKSGERISTFPEDFLVSRSPVA